MNIFEAKDEIIEYYVKHPDFFSDLCEQGGFWVDDICEAAVEEVVKRCYEYLSSKKRGMIEVLLDDTNFEYVFNQVYKPDLQEGDEIEVYDIGFPLCQYGYTETFNSLIGFRGVISKIGSNKCYKISFDTSDDSYAIMQAEGLSYCDNIVKKVEDNFEFIPHSDEQILDFLS